MKNKKGFTLIELLAVVIILAITSTVAIIGVSRYINESKKNVYIKNAEKYIDAMKIMNSKEVLDLKRKDTTYYVHIANIKLENDGESPFGKWQDAYVAFSNNDSKSNYYWTSVDDVGNKVNVTIESNLKPSNIFVDPLKRLNNSYPLEGKMNIIIIDKNGNRIKGYPSLELSKDEAERCYTLRENLDDTITITLYNPECGSNVVLPAYIDGKKVVEVFDYAFRSAGLTKIIFSNTVEKIGTRSFSYNLLTSVEIPPNLKVIGMEAFLANQIADLNINEGVTTLGLKAFFSNQIPFVNLPESVTSLASCVFCANPIPNPEFLYATVNGQPDYSTIRGYIGDLREFTDNKFIIPAERNGVKLKVIQANFVQGLPIAGWEVVIPSTVTHIGTTAFWGCNIAKVNLPEGLVSIGNAAFYVNRLTELHIPSTVTYIGPYAFNNNQVIDPVQSIVYNRSSSGVDYSSIISYAGRNRSNIVIPEVMNGVPLKRIENHAFAYISSGGVMRIPPTVNYIGTNAFSINNLTSLDNGDGVLGKPFVYARKETGGIDNTTIIGYAGSGGIVEIPSQVKHIAPYGFYYTRLTGVIFPEGLETIGYAAFGNCVLGDIIIPSTVTSIGASAFQKVKVYTDYNFNIKTIRNKTGRSFDWRSITSSHYPATFETGTVKNWYGNIEVVK